MKTIDIYGENRFERYSKMREACRGILIKDGKILMSYEVNTDQWFIPGGGVEYNESLSECCMRELAEGLEPRWIPLKEAIDIFSKHQDYAADNEMKRGAYLREYNALLSYSERKG